MDKKIIHKYKEEIIDETTHKIMGNYKRIFCSCGEEFTHDGWNIKEMGQGNNYHYKSIDGYSIKYTTCTGCGKQVVLSKNKFAK